MRSLLSLLLLGLCSLSLQAQGVWDVRRTGIADIAQLSSVAYGNRRFVVVGREKLAHSADGRTWTAAATYPGRGYRVFFSREQFYYVGPDGLWRSRDGDAWARVGERRWGNNAPSNVASDGHSMLVYTDPSPTLLFSTDFETFRSTVPLPHTDQPNLALGVNALVYAAGRYFVAYFAGPRGGNWNGYIVSTIDGTSWTPVADGLVNSFHMAGTSDRCLIIQFLPQTRMLFTRDGTTFTSHRLPTPASNNQTLLSAAGRFFFSPTFLSTLDAETWTLPATITLPNANYMRDLVYGNNRYVGVGHTNIDPSQDLVATLVSAAPPVFASHPAPATVAEGENVTLTGVLENPTPATTFRWLRDGVPIPGASLPTYTLPRVAFSSAGRYVLEATNPLGANVSNPAQVTVLPATARGRLINLSILSSLDTPDAEFLVGFVVSGTGGEKPLLARVAGPSLALFNVAAPNANPRLDLYTGNVLRGSNDDWAGAAAIDRLAAELGAFSFVSPNSRDAALLTSLPPDNHTLKVSATNGATGAVIAELYDATRAQDVTASTPRLINVSVRKNLGAGATLNTGFVIGGSSPRTVLIRAVGPGLGAFGLIDFLADPSLTLRVAGRTEAIASNNNWDSQPGISAELRAAFSAVGAFALPAGSLDAVISAKLSPGAYTAEVTAPAEASGSVLLEVYEVP